MNQHCMLDLETMSQKAHMRPAIVSIGATHFDADRIIDKFYISVNLADCLVNGLQQTKNTIDWWSKQSVEARAAWQNEAALPLMDALTKFVHWTREFSSQKTLAPWGNGSSFDITAMESAFECFDVDPPWEFYNVMCFRTLKNMFEVSKMPREGTHHNALDDAVYQTEHLQRILKIHKIALK